MHYLPSFELTIAVAISEPVLFLSSYSNPFLFPLSCYFLFDIN